MYSMENISHGIIFGLQVGLSVGAAVFTGVVIYSTYLSIFDHETRNEYLADLHNRYPSSYFGRKAEQMLTKAQTSSPIQEKPNISQNQNVSEISSDFLKDRVSELKHASPNRLGEPSDELKDLVCENIYAWDFYTSYLETASNLMF